MTSLAELPSYTLMQLPPDLTGEPPNEAALKAEFEKGDTKTKIAALKKVLYFILNGEKFPGLLMTIIRFVLPSQVGFLKIVISPKCSDHQISKFACIVILNRLLNGFF